MKRYILLKPDEDGCNVNILAEDEVKDIKQLMENYGVEKWKDSFAPEADVSYCWKQR